MHNDEIVLQSPSATFVRTARMFLRTLLSNYQSVAKPNLTIFWVMYGWFRWRIFILIVKRCLRMISGQGTIMILYILRYHHCFFKSIINRTELMSMIWRLETRDWSLCEVIYDLRDETMVCIVMQLWVLSDAIDEISFAPSYSACAHWAWSACSSAFCWLSLV